MRKGILIGLLGLLVSAGLSAQQLSNILMNVNGKAQYKVSAGNTLIYLDDQGKILSVETDASGEVIYNKNFQPQQVGNLIIQYDHTGRIDKIGELVFRYNYQNQISSVGNISINYNANKTIDQIGVYKIYYNYSGKISRMDSSKGLIALQLNFSK
ncbi:MAG: hypothetical protein RI983_965 [Bacteroidota bacterium]|jgi:hypothetical protein